MINKATIVLGGKQYTVEIMNGERFIDGEPIDKFIDNCDSVLLVELSNIGLQALRDEVKGTKPRGYQKMVDNFFRMRN